MPKFDSKYIKNAVAKKNIAEQRFKIFATETKSPVTPISEQKMGLLKHRKLLSPTQTPTRLINKKAIEKPLINVTKLT